MKSSRLLLEECLAEPSLEEETREAFEGMLAALESGERRSLSERQREWVAGVHGRLGLDPGVANLVSSGAVKVTDAERESLREFHASLGPKPLKPPARRAQP